MPKYRVTGEFTVDVTAYVECDSPEEALERVERELYTENYAGMGDTDHLVGIDNADDITVGISPSTIEWHKEVDEADEED